jgi:tetratricopeptide (TPR) repeat protein
LEAASQYREAVRARPGITSDWISLAEIYKKLGNREQTVASYKAAANLESNNVSLRVALGAAYRETGQIDSAIACLREAVQLQPNHKWAQVGLGVNLLHKGDARAAVAAGRAALPQAIEHERDGVNFGLGISLQAAGDRDAAVVAWRATLRGAEEQIRKEPMAWDPYMMMSRILSNSDDERLSDPHRAVDLAHRGLLLCQQQFQKGPKDWYDSFVGYCWANLGLAYYRSGNWVVAARVSEKAVSLLPDDAQVVQTRLVLACAYARLGQKKLARRWYVKAAEWLERTHCRDPIFLKLQTEAAGLLHLDGLHITAHPEVHAEGRHSASFSSRAIAVSTGR